MIGCYIMLRSGLGNLMFQACAMEYIAKQHNQDLVYYYVDKFIKNLATSNPWEAHAYEYFSIFKNIDYYKNQYRSTELNVQVKVPFCYVDFTPMDGTIYSGYFQSEKYFTHEFAQWLFEPTFSIDQYDYFQGKTCSIHVRRGDYLFRQLWHPVLPMSYYEDAMGMVMADRYLVFSDDIEWCRENFRGDQFVFPDLVNYVELYLMAKCDCNIIANSSFSWWGAYLGVKDKMVIAPKLWFGPAASVNDRDLVPDRWIRI